VAWIRWLAPISQFAAVLCTGTLLFSDLPFCLMIQTWFFVALNKVITAQYFLWVFVFLPICLHRLSVDYVLCLKLVASWIIVVANWLFWAWLLEFKMWNVFFLVWLGSVVFLGTNLWIIYSLLKVHQPGGKLVKIK